MTVESASTTTLDFEEPSWLFEGSGDERVTAAEAARFLGDLDGEDFGVFVLAYGFGMRFGAVSRTLKLDPALVAWRLRRALERWRRGSPDAEPSPRALENGLLALLRNPPDEDLPEPPGGSRSWRVTELMGGLETEVRGRLEAHMSQARDTAPVRPGVGVGLAALVILGAVLFTIFGALSDEHPMRKGRELIKQRRYSEARASFMRLGQSPQGQKFRALCYVAEGRFGDAFGLFQGIEVLDTMGQFAPRERALVPLADVGTGAAELPRGPVLRPRPDFVVAEPVDDELQVTILDISRSFTTAGPGGAARSRIPLPKSWGALPAGTIRWTLKGDPGSWAEFEVLTAERRSELLDHIRRRVPAELRNTPAATFLEAQLFLNQGLLTEAGERLAELTRAFPDEVYPSNRLAEVAAALGVDPVAFLR